MSDSRRKIRAVYLAAMLTMWMFVLPFVTTPVVAAPSVSSANAECVASCGTSAGNVDADASIGPQGKSLSFKLKAGNAENSYESKVDLSSAGTAANTETQYQIDIVVSDFNPDLSYGRANHTGTWSESTSGGQRTISLKTRPIQYAANTQESGTTVNNWPSQNIGADVTYDANVRFWMFDIGSGAQAGNVDGSYILTDSQAFSGPSVSDSNNQFRVPVAAPHTNKDGTLNNGFLKAHLTTGMIDYIYENPTDNQFVTQFSGQRNDGPSITDINNGGKVVTWNDYHYSAGNNAVEDDTTVDTVDAGSDTSTTTGSSVTLDGTGSSDSAGIKSYEWDVDDDGSYEKSGSTVGKSWSSTGTKKVTLRVTDNNDNTATDVVNVSVSSNGGGGGGGGSTPTPSPTPTSTPSPTPAATPTPTSTPTPTAVPTTPSSTPTQSPTPAATPTPEPASPTPTAEPGAQGSTDTPGGTGPGFGVFVSVASLLAAVWLALRRRE